MLLPPQFLSRSEAQLAALRCSCLRKSSSFSASVNKAWWVCGNMLIHDKKHQTRCMVLLTGAEGCSGPAPNHTMSSWTLWFLCTQDPSAYPQPSSQDLANFWDLLQLNIEDVRIKFQDLQRVKESGWRLPPEKKVRGSGGQMALLSLQHQPRTKATTCRRAAQMVTPAEAVEALKVQNSVGIWPDLRDILNLYKCKSQGCLLISAAQTKENTRLHCNCPQWLPSNHISLIPH